LHILLRSAVDCLIYPSASILESDVLCNYLRSGLSKSGYLGFRYNDSDDLIRARGGFGCGLSRDGIIG
jgi:hypothetical protein